LPLPNFVVFKQGFLTEIFYTDLSFRDYKHRFANLTNSSVKAANIELLFSARQHIANA